MKTYLKSIVRFSHDANLKLIAKFSDGDLHYVIEESSKKLISHILNVETYWLNKARGCEAIDLWKVWPVEDLKNIANRNFKEISGLLDNTQLEQDSTNPIPSDESSMRTLQDIVFHIVNTASYYRGQISAEFQIKHIDPVEPDYLSLKG